MSEETIYIVVRSSISIGATALEVLGAFRDKSEAEALKNAAQVTGKISVANIEQRDIIETVLK